MVKLPREIDLGNAPRLHREAARIIDERVGRLRLLVLDLTDTTFIDSRGIELIAATGERTRRRGAALRLAVTEPQVARILTLTNLRRDVPVYASVVEAITGRPWEVPGPRPTES
ncbi:MAG TPA: STAS domain-containing protein [Streptomyces sp.]|nr:STAS domain-containing protein [Streptomyces sp.]